MREDRRMRSGRGAAAARRRHRHRSHHPGAVPARVTFDGLEQHVFEDDRKTADAHSRIPSTIRAIAGASVLVVNANFGCGSSREHAPQALQRWGIQAVVGESFAEIFFGNSVMIGLPCVTAAPADVRALMERIEREPGRRDARRSRGRHVRGRRLHAAPCRMPPNVRDAFVTGAWDTTGMLLDRYDEVDADAARLPYVSGF